MLGLTLLATCVFVNNEGGQLWCFTNVLATLRPNLRPPVNYPGPSSPSSQRSSHRRFQTYYAGSNCATVIDATNS